MIRILGISLNLNKRILIALTYIYGIGKSRSMKICKNIKINPNLKTSSLSIKNINILRNEIYKYEIEGDLRRRIGLNIKRLYDVKCYKGFRHKLKLPVRGQRTKTNAKTSKKRILK